MRATARQICDDLLWANFLACMQSPTTWRKPIRNPRSNRQDDDWDDIWDEPVDQ